jgi:hypothetical protein
MKNATGLVITAGTLILALSACGSGSPSPQSSTTSSQRASSSPPASSPSPSDSNPATTFSDGSRVEVTSAGGGPGNVHVTLKVTAGPQNGLPLGNTGALEIMPVDSSGQDPWSSPEALQYYNLSDTSASNPISPPDPLTPGTSVCVVQTFDDPSNPQESANVSSWRITMTLGNGATGKIALPAGGGAGPDCNID